MNESMDCDGCHKRVEIPETVLVALKGHAFSRAVTHLFGLTARLKPRPFKAA
jgi:hypothetical protein